MKELPGIPDRVELGQPFFGLLSAPSRAEVALFLMANGRDSFSISEIARARRLSRLSVKSAVDALLEWGQARVVNPGDPRPRYAVNEESPITMALDLLTAATSEAIFPTERVFASAVQDLWEVLRSQQPPSGGPARVPLRFGPDVKLQAARAGRSLAAGHRAPVRAARGRKARPPKR